MAERPLPTSESLIQEIRKSLNANVDQSNLKKIRELVPTDEPIIGVKVPKIRALTKSFISSNKKLSLDQVCNLFTSLTKTRCREEVLFGTFLLAHYKKQFSSSLWPTIETSLKSITNWETCDQLAMNIAAELVARDLTLVDRLVTLAKSKNHWHRRFAVATTAALNQRGRSHPLETLRVCALLMKDEHPIVQKAVGWAIREATEKDEPAVFHFLKSRRGKASSKIIREAAEKLTTHHQLVLSKLEDRPPKGPAQ
jgi:3-methyladenine DNA glycosylase AlkD